MSATDYVRLNSHIRTIATEARGTPVSDSSGNWRFGSKAALCVFSNGQFHDFSGGAREHGYSALQLIEHLYPNEDATAWARAWLEKHPGDGSFTPGEGEGEPAEDFAEIEATAFIDSLLYNGAVLTDDTPGYAYIVQTRRLPLRTEDQAQLRWVANYRGDEGALLAPITDDSGALVRLMVTFVTRDSLKSPHKPDRITIRGAKRPGLLRMGIPSPHATETEGLEKGLAARASGAEYVVVTGGISNLGRAPLPPVTQSVVIARDADDPGSSPDQALWRGVVRRLGQGLKTAVTVRPNDIAPKDAPWLKDVDDLFRYDAELVPILLGGANLEHGRLGETVDGAILDLASRLDAVALGRARKGVAQLLGISLGALDDELARRVRARIEARENAKTPVILEPWGEQVTPGVGVLALLDGVNVIAHNVSFELSFLEAAGVALGELHCTLQATRLMLGEYSTSLAEGAAAFLHLDLDKTLQASDWNAPHLSRQQIDYAGIDAVVAWRIAEKILPRFDVQRSAYEIQVSVVPAVMRMEQRGFKLDVDAHARLITDLKDKRVGAEQDYREACRDGGHVGLTDKPAPSTPAQKADLLTILLTSDELARWRRTEKSGALSTRRSELLRAGHYPPIRALVKLSRIDKRLASFGPTLAALVSPISGRIHAHYKVAGTASGRASCAGPNLQQIPRTSELADFRALFVPELGCLLIVADYAMMEMRAAAYISDDRAMTEAFEQGIDLHKLTAARMIGGNGKDIADVTETERAGAKAVNFGAIFGQGASGLVKSAWDQWEIVLDLDEAKAWVKSFENSYFEYARWRRNHYRLCQSRRNIVIGRDAARGIGRIFPFSRLPEGNNGYTRSCNLPVQGGCADASMLALAYVDDRLFNAGIDGGPVAWLHDEIVLEVRVEQAEQAAEILKQSMIDGFAETFPGAPLNGLVKLKIGESWGAAKG